MIYQQGQASYGGYITISTQKQGSQLSQSTYPLQFSVYQFTSTALAFILIVLIIHGNPA